MSVRGVSYQKGVFRRRLDPERGTFISQVESRENKIGFASAERIAGAVKVGVDWLLYGNEEKKHYPVNDRLVAWLWHHEDLRKILWEKIENEECGDNEG